MKIPGFSSRFAMVAVCGAMVLTSGGAMVGMDRLLRAQEAQRWQAALNNVAQAGAVTLQQWVAGQRNVLSNLANNPALSIYFLAMRAEPSLEGEALAQGQYLGQMLGLGVQKLGMKPGAGGIMLTDMNMTPAAQTADTPAINSTLTERVLQLPRGETALLDIPATDVQPEHMALVVPVYAVQAAHIPENQIGHLIALRPMDAAVMASLKPANMPFKTLRLNLQSTEPSLGAQAETLSAVQAVNGTPWVLTTHVDATEAYAMGAEQRSIAVAGVGAAMLALWLGVVAISRHASARRAGKYMVEREARIRTLNQLVAVLVSLVDRRDPNAAEHSARVAQIAGLTARALELDSTLVETTEIAAKLCNIGKMDVPRELLNSTAVLAETDRVTIRSTLASAAELLEGIAFDGPVVATLRQAQEHVDGSGPHQLVGEQILISARIIAAANAYVGMTSQRAYRPAMSPDAAAQVLQSLAGSQFDPEVIACMMEQLAMPEADDMMDESDHVIPLRARG